MKHFFLALVLIPTFLFAQKERFTLMTYNLMYYKAPSAPCSQPLSFAQKDQAFKTVFKEILPDILCVNEIGAYPDNSAAQSVLQNVLNTDGEVNFTSADYTNNANSSITNMLFYDSTKFALKNQSYISSGLNNTSLPRVIDFYRMYYKEPGLRTGDTTFFTIVACHLKAGSSGPDINERAVAAATIMDYLTHSVADENVILTGDLNLYGNNEAAYQEFTNYSENQESFVDPGAAGQWHNNSNYAYLHTQNTHSSSSGCYAGGGMDDRFDFIMHSKPIANESAGMNFRQNSLRAFGNDGNRFNQSIKAGTNMAVTAAVADALYDFSDHVPVVAEYEVSVAGVGLNTPSVKNPFRYNNPFRDKLTMTRAGDKGRLNIEIRDISGRLVANVDFPPRQARLSLPTLSWPPGIYLITVFDEKAQVYTKKLIKDPHGVY